MLLTGFVSCLLISPRLGSFASPAVGAGSADGSSAQARAGIASASSNGVARAHPSVRRAVISDSRRRRRPFALVDRSATAPSVHLARGQRRHPLRDLAVQRAERGALGGDQVLEGGRRDRLLDARFLDRERAAVARGGDRPAHAQHDRPARDALELPDVEQDAIRGGKARLGRVDRDARGAEQTAEVVGDHAQDVVAQRASPAVRVGQHQAMRAVARHDLRPIEVARETRSARPRDRDRAARQRRAAGGARSRAQRVEVGLRAAVPSSRRRARPGAWRRALRAGRRISSLAAFLAEDQGIGLGLDLIRREPERARGVAELEQRARELRPSRRNRGRSARSPKPASARPARACRAAP